MHAAHGNFGRAVASAGLRGLAALVGFYASPELSDGGKRFAVLVAVMGAVAEIDEALLAWQPREQSP